MGWKVGTLSFRGDAQYLPAAILDLGPNGYWKLNETTGLIAHDSSGYGRDGIYQPGVQIARQRGPYGVYPNFRQPSGPGVVIPDSDDWTFNLGGGTVAAMVRFGRTELPDTGAVLVAAKGGEWTLGKGNIGLLLSAVLGSAGIHAGAEGIGHPIGDNTDLSWTERWHLVVATFSAGDPATTNFLTDSGWSGTAFGPYGTRTTNQATTLTLGAVAEDTTGDARHLAHVAVWNRILDSTELSSLMDAADRDHWHPA